MNILNNKQERTRFLKFSFVGLTGTIVDFGFMNLLILVFHLPLAWSQSISFGLAVLNNFLWNRYWTYPDSRSKGVQKQLFQFVIINIIGILIRIPLVPWLDNQLLTILQKTYLNLPLPNSIISQNLALASAILIIIFWNFFANRYWTYGDVSNGKESVHPIDEKIS